MTAAVVLVDDGRARTPEVPGVRRQCATDAQPPRPHEVWVARDSSPLARRVPAWPRHRLPRASAALVLIDRPEPGVKLLLEAAFGRVVERPDAVLSPEDIPRALASPHRADLCLGGSVQMGAQVAVLLRGDLAPLVVPLTLFQPAGQGLRPDFTAFAVDDGGQTLRFGAYEAAFDAVLYELDPAFRRREQRQRPQSEQGLGSAIRRLRLQRRLKLDEFPGVPERTLGRIERGEVRRPHKATLQAIAHRLGVEAADLASY